MRRTGADRLAVAMKLGNASGAKGAGCPGMVVQANHVVWEELAGQSAAGHGCVGTTSRVRREAYARFCERQGVRLPLPTRHSKPP
jgi:hypothetical protein